MTCDKWKGGGKPPSSFLPPSKVYLHRTCIRRHMPKEFPSNFSSPPSFLFSPSQKCRKISNAISSKACLPPSLPPPLFTQESFVKGEKETAAFQSYFPFSKVRLWESVVSLRLFFLPPWFCRGGGETYGLAWEWDTTKKKAPPTLPH